MISPHQGSLLFLLCFLPLVALCHKTTAATQSSTPTSSCTRTCGSTRTVSFPFGFSAGCPIRLNCSASGEMLLGEYLITNITSDTVVVAVPPVRDRPARRAEGLFGNNYALTARNVLVFLDCATGATSVCAMPPEFLCRWFNATSCRGAQAGDFRCYFSGGDTQGFLSQAGFEASAAGCDVLLATVNLGLEGPPFFGFSKAEVGWWLRGEECRCAANASCTRVDLPQSAGNGTGFRCRCWEGFEGDGFADGGGCRRTEQIRCSTCGSGKATISVLIGVSAAVGSLLVCAAVFLHLRRRSQNSFWDKSNSAQTVQAIVNGYLAPKRYRYSDLKKITKSFHEKLGEGGYGSVYKGTLKDGRPVAVKILNNTKKDGVEFMNEVTSIGRTSHVNIVSLLGFCVDGRRRALVYEYMSNGSLEKHIFSDDPKGTLSWDCLYKIAVGIARGLEYLHRGCSTRIVHFDIKPHNVLLDEEFCPKISDFGLAKLCPKKVSVFSMEHVRGTIGYIAPEVVSRNFGKASTKSDVYSYGMMVLEMTVGRRNVDAQADRKSQVFFPSWVFEHIDQADDMRAYDVTTEAEEVARKMILVGLWCIQIFPVHRPSMSRVVEMLEGKASDIEMPPTPGFSSVAVHSVVDRSRLHSVVSSLELSSVR